MYCKGKVKVHNQNVTYMFLFMGKIKRYLCKNDPL